MNIYLNEDNEDTFISNIKDNVWYIETLTVITSNKKCYNIIFDLLNNIPKDIINIIFEYTKEEYNIKYEIHTYYNLIPQSETQYYDDSVYDKQIDITFTHVKNNKKKYKMNIGIDYIYKIHPTEEYEYRTNNGYKKIPYTNDVDITLSNETCGSDTWDDFLTNTNLTYSENVSIDMINVIVFVVNRMIKIMINEDKNIIDDTYLKKIE